MMRLKVLGTGLAAGLMCAVMGLNAFAAEITRERAEEIALEDAKVDREQVSFIWTELDYDDGRKVYDVEFVTKDYTEYDYEIDGENGNILGMDYDAEYEWKNLEKGNGGKDKPSRTSDSIGLEKAKEAALEKAGLKDSQVTWGKVEQDYDDGRVVYEGKFFYDNTEYEFEVDGRDGRVIDWEVERFYR